MTGVAWVWTMNIVLGETGPALSPTAGQDDAHRIENGSLAGVVWADNDVGVTKLNI